MVRLYYQEWPVILKIEKVQARSQDAEALEAQKLPRFPLPYIRSRRIIEGTLGSDMLGYVDKEL